MKTVVLLHGWGMNRSVFDDFAGFFPPHYTLHTPDLPGYGATAACEPYTLDNLAAAVASGAPERCLVAGWSLGALVALSWAFAAPRQVERLALLGGTPCFVQRGDWKPAIETKVFEAFAESVRRDRLGTLERFISLQARGDAHAKRVIRRLRAALVARALPDGEVLEQGLRILREVDVRELLPAIAPPTLVVHGEHDALVPLVAARMLAEALPCARLAIVPGAAHAPFLSDPGEVGRMLSEFFA